MTLNWIQNALICSQVDDGMPYRIIKPEKNGMCGGLQDQISLTSRDWLQRTLGTQMLYLTSKIYYHSVALRIYSLILKGKDKDWVWQNSCIGFLMLSLSQEVSTRAHFNCSSKFIATYTWCFCPGMSIWEAVPKSFIWEWSQRHCPNGLKFWTIRIEACVQNKPHCLEKQSGTAVDLYSLALDWEHSKRQVLRCQSKDNISSKSF
jgi:hypothetical protein